MYVPPTGNTEHHAEYADQLDLQSVLAGLLYWQSKGPNKLKNLNTAFEKLSAYYAKDPHVAEKTEDKNSIPSKKFYEKDHITTRKRRGHIYDKKVDVIYQFTTDGNAEYETHMGMIQSEASQIYDLLVASYEKLYNLRPEKEIQQENEMGRIPDPNRPNFVVENNQGASMWDFILNRRKKKTIFAYDDQLSPYRRTSDVLKQIQETPALLERLNALHTYSILRVDALGISIQQQLSRLSIEKLFLKAHVKQKITLYASAAMTLKILAEQQHQKEIITRSYEVKDQRRDPTWVEGMKKQTSMG